MYLHHAFPICLILLTGGDTFELFRGRIPNGEFVKHPCLPNYIWRGVGHTNPRGGGPRNPFGQDFDNNGQVWNKDLCEMDSDGDGRSNGLELGDPNCVWKENETPELQNFHVTHPGVCEPIDSAECLEKNPWTIDCSIPEFQCDAVDDEGVLSTSFSFEPTLIHPVDTTYLCQIVELPSDQEYHLIAGEPIVDNENALHHLFLYGIPDIQVPLVKSIFSNASACVMGGFPNSDIMFTWSVGLDGDCLEDNVGVPMGINGFKYAVIEKHLTNPLKLEGMMDGSGIKIYYTPVVREYNRATILVGPIMLQIPPKREAAIHHGGCSEFCSRSLFKQPYFITSIYPHMHYLGRKLKVEVLRNDTVIMVLVDEQDFFYDSATPVLYNPPIKMEPGDVIDVTCEFNTQNRDQMVFFGASSFLDEMCFAYIEYYPKQNGVSACVGQNGISWCGGQFNNYQDFGKHQDCLPKIFLFVVGGDDQREELRELYAKLIHVCDPTGRECWAGCEAAIAKVRKHPCLDREIEHVFMTNIVRRNIMPQDFLYMLNACTYGEGKYISV